MALLVLCLTAAILPHGDCEVCYRCSYYVHRGGTVVGKVVCNDPFSESVETRNLAVTCDGMCVKHIFRDGGRVYHLYRNCLPTCTAGAATRFGLSGHVYCCKGDLCNACPDRGAVSAAMVFVVVLAAVTSS